MTIINHIKSRTFILIPSYQGFQRNKNLLNILLGWQSVIFPLKKSAKKFASFVQELMERARVQKSFPRPVHGDLICTAYAENLTL